MYEILLPMGVEFKRAAVEFDEFESVKKQTPNINGYTVLWYESTPFTFDLGRFTSQLNAPKNIYPSLDKNPFTNAQKCIKNENLKIAFDRASVPSKYYVDEAKHINYKPLKQHDEFIVAFNQDLKRCLNEMVAAHVYINLFKLKAQEYELCYYQVTNSFVLKSNRDLYPSTVQQPNIRANHAYSSQFLVDCIMCNWDVYIDNNTILVDRELYRVHVDGCLQFVTRGENRTSFNLIKPNDHDILFKNSTIDFDFSEQNIKANSKRLSDAKSRFDKFEQDALVKFESTIKELDCSSTLHAKYILFVSNQLQQIRKRLDYYVGNGERILNSFTQMQKGGAQEPTTITHLATTNDDQHYKFGNMVALLST